VLAFADTDEYIFSGTPANTYVGRTEAPDLIYNLDFEDVPDDFWAKDAIVRMGALNIIKSYSRNFFPNSFISNEVLVAFILRAIGMEQIAHERALALRAGLPDMPTTELWSLGYLNQAMEMGLLTQLQFAESMIYDQTTLDPATNFVRGAPVTREAASDLILRGLQIVNSAVFELERTEQSIYKYSDWSEIEPQYVHAVEIMSEANIMSGGEDGLFRPKSYLTRAEIAQILKNIDSLYYPLIGVEKKFGTVGAIRDAQDTTTGVAGLNRDVYVRNSTGLVDVLRYTISQSSSPQSGKRDAVTLRKGKVAGLADLREGDEIEYLVVTQSYALLYVQVTDNLNIKTVRGKLERLDMTTGKITITDVLSKTYSYTMATYLYGVEDYDQYVIVSKKHRNPTQLPFGTKIELRLKNDIVDEIDFIGEDILIDEYSGVVLENNPLLGYMKVLDSNGTASILRYYYGNVKVERKEYYDNTDEVGFIDSLFKNYKHDPADSNINEIKPGDIITYQTDESGHLSQVYAYRELCARFGKILNLKRHENTADLLLEYEDGEVVLHTISDGVYVSKALRPISLADIQPGDWVKLLVNSVYLRPGGQLESVLEMVIDSKGALIDNIVTGQFSGVDTVQRQIILQNVKTLGGGFASNQNMDNRQILRLNLAETDTEYYYGNEKISLDYALARLKNFQVYAALENVYAGIKVRKMTFRDGRDQLLNPDVVLGSEGMKFYMSGNSRMINTDDGTIVRRFGRLTGVQDIAPRVFATVNLNGEDTAAVVDITHKPDSSGVIIARGRVLSVNDGKSFKVESMAMLYDGEWSYSPVERIFSIDNETLFIDENGVHASYTFRGYTSNSVVGKVFNIVIDGSRAARVIDAPYSTGNIRGIVYQKADNVVSIRDVSRYDDNSGIWKKLNEANAMDVAIRPNTIAVKNNGLIDAEAIVIGDEIRVLTNAENAAATAGIDGYIISVENFVP
jgi:hypothetical protein